MPVTSSLSPVRIFRDPVPEERFRRFTDAAIGGSRKEAQPDEVAFIGSGIADWAGMGR